MSETKKKKPAAKKYTRRNKITLYDKADDTQSKILLDWFREHCETMSDDQLESYKDKHGHYDKPKLRADSLKIDVELKTRITKDTGISLTINKEYLDHLFTVYDKEDTFAVPYKGKTRNYNDHTGYYYIWIRT